MTMQVYGSPCDPDLNRFILAPLLLLGPPFYVGLHARYLQTGLQQQRLANHHFQNIGLHARYLPKQAGS